MGRDDKVYSEIIINASPNEMRVAIMEDHRLVEFFAERADSMRQVGNICKGRVNAVLPGMQAAFIDIGQEKTAFLHVSDMIVTDPETNDAAEQGGRRSGSRSRKIPRGVSIDNLLKKGQEIMVQITKEPIGTKGPRVTTQVSLPGRYLVLMPNVSHLGVSRKIEDRNERTRLRQLLGEVVPKGYGAIMRTVGIGRDKHHFEADIKGLTRIWKKAQAAYAKMTAPAILHKELELTTGLIRDIFNEDVDRLIIDSKDHVTQAHAYLNATSPELIDRVTLYEEETPLFDAYEIESEIEKTLSSKIWLKRGGYIIIDHAEALVAIDVNTGRFTGDKDQEETITQTNVEAAREVARQLRLRDMGGIIVIDFIDMEKESNREKVSDTLRRALRRDRAKTKTFRISDLGLVEMTRQRVRPSLMQYFSSNCPHCGGTGRRLSLASLAAKVERLLRRVATYCNEKRIVVHLHPELAGFFEEGELNRLEGIQKRYDLDVEIHQNAGHEREEVRIFAKKSGQELTQKVVF